jgi:hypothetical protein
VFFDVLVKNLRYVFRSVTIPSLIFSISIAAGATVLLFRVRVAPGQTLVKFFDAYSVEIQAFIFLSVGLSATVPYLLRYLKSSPEEESSTGDVLRRTREARNLLTTVQKEIAEFRQLVVNRTSADTSIDTSSLIEKLRSTLTKDVAQDIKKEFERQIATLAYIERIRQIFVNDERRLFDQIAILRKRGNLNLVIGIVTTLLAAITLVLTITFANPSSSDPQKMTIYFVSRISTVIFIEVFSFFFLRLYKSTLAEEKYYQNEITARTARQSALEAAFSGSDAVAVPKLVEMLVGVNQNESKSKKSEDVDIKELGTLVESAAKVISSFATKSHGAE